MWGRKIPPPRSILILKTHAIGDVLMISPSLKAIRRKFPEAHISLLIGSWSKDAAIGNPNLDEVIVFEDAIFFNPDFRKMLRLVRELRRRHFDWMIAFHASSFLHLFGLLVGIPYRVGFDENGSGFSLTLKVPWDSNDERYVPERYFEIPRKLSADTKDYKLELFLSKEDVEFANDFLRKHGIREYDLIVGLCPGGAKNPAESVPARVWDIKNFAALGDAISEQLNGVIIVFGAPSDRERVSKLINLMQHKPINACGETNFKQFAALIQRCSILITNDSAPLHVAVAVGTHSVCMFGPTNGTSRLPHNEKHVAIQSKMECSPCYGYARFPGCPNPQCMSSIKPEEVLDVIKERVRRMRGERLSLSP